MQTVTLLKGLPASGKSTRARELVALSGGKTKRVNKDDLRAMVDDKFSKDKEKFILSLRDAAITSALSSGYSVIVDDTNLHPKHEQHIRELVHPIEVLVDDSFLLVPMRECIRRDALRTNPVGKEVIRRMAKSLETPKKYFVEGLPSCVICDLDGTLALMGKRSPFDASTCEQDELNFPVAHFLRFLALEFTVFYFSGREDKYVEPTLTWLRSHNLDFHKELVMRPTGNFDKDVLVKGRMFEEYIRGKFNVHVVLDDRNQVVENWRDLGLNVFQVNEGDF